MQSSDTKKALDTLRRRGQLMNDGSDELHPMIEPYVEALNENIIPRRQFLSYVTAFGATISSAYALAGLAVPAPAQAATPKKGGILRISMQVIDFLDPALAEWNEQSNVFRAVNEYLVNWNSDGSLEPHLLESWSVSDDAKTWTLKIRKGVTFNNGDLLDVDDVIFNLKRWMRPELGSSNASRLIGLMQDAETIEKDGKQIVVRRERPGALERIDDYTLRLNMVTTDITILPGLSGYPTAIVHRDFEKQGSDWTKNPIGTGPFELVSFKVQESAELKRRDGWWKGDVHLDGIRYIDFGAESSAEIQAFASGQVDMTREIDTSQIPIYESLGEEFEILEAVTALTIVIRVRLGEEKSLDDPRVRRALQLSVDNNKVLEFVLQNRGMVGENHHVCPLHPEYAKLDAMPKYDPARAKKLLAEAGYEDGVKLTLTCNADVDWEVLAAQAVSNQARAGGFDIAIEPRPGTAYWPEWDRYAFSITQWNPRPLGIQIYNFAYRSGGVWNETNYANPELDALLDRASALPDPKERTKLMAQLETILQDSGVIIQPFWRQLFSVKRREVKGYDLHPATWIRAETVYFDA